MLKFNNFLVENQEINLSMKIYKSLSEQAREAIDGYEAYSWHTGKLSQAVKQKNEIYQEIRQAFTPIREYLKKKNGQYITLYRGYRTNPILDEKDPHESYRVLTSWTSDKRVAGHFAGVNDYKYTHWKDGKKQDRGSWREFGFPSHTDAEIQQMVDSFKKRGYAQDRNYHYMINKESPQYYNIYYRNSRKFVTDGYTKDFEEDMRYNAKQNREDRTERTYSSKITEKKIDIDKILWITNNLSSKEYIVEN